MTRQVLSAAFMGLAIVLIANSCTKSDAQLQKENCANILKTKIKVKDSVYYTGDTIYLATTLEPSAYFEWRQTNQPNAIGTGAHLAIYNVTKNDEGWYYLIVNNQDCENGYDSVYIKVKNRPASASCSPANNSVSFSAIPSVNYGSVSWGMDPSWNCKNLAGNPAYGYPDINVYFHPFWNNAEPEDGEYTVNTDGFMWPNDPYTVNMATTYSSIYFMAGPGKAYVSHSGGKIQVTFCSVPLSGDWGGQAYTTTATGQLTAP